MSTPEPPTEPELPEANTTSLYSKLFISTDTHPIELKLLLDERIVCVEPYGENRSGENMRVWFQGTPESRRERLGA